MDLAGVFRRKKAVDSGTLERVLAAPPPERARDLPFDTRLPWTQATTAVITQLVFVVGVLGVIGVIFGTYTPTATGIAAVLLSTALVVGSSFVRGGLNPDRRLSVSEQGVRVERLFGSKSVAWWNVTAIRAKPDLSEILVDANGGGVAIQTSGMDEEGRAGTLMALRVRLGADQPIVPWTPSRLNRRSVANLAGTIGSILLVGSFYLGVAPARSLGIRCSGPSSYFDARFGLPPGEQGCVVLRVSGAAARAGVRQGDRMVAMNGAPITSGEQFNDRFFDEGDSDFVFTFVRSGISEPIEIHVSMGASTSPSTPNTDPLAWFLRARGNPDRKASIEQYSRAIQLAPDFDLAYLFRGELKLEGDDFEAAFSDLQQAIALNPSSAEANRALAMYYEGQIFVASAVPRSYIERAIQLHNCSDGFLGQNLDCAHDYVVLADLLRFRADTPGSIEAARQAMPYYPKAASPLYQLALSYEIADDKEQAMLHARQYLARPSSQRDDTESKRMRALLRRLGSPAH